MKIFLFQLITLSFFTQTLWAKPEMQKLVLQLDWLHQFQFAGYYMAKEKGFYKQKNLDVKIKEFSVGTNILNDVTQGRTHYATGKSSLIINKLRGAKIVALAAIYQHSPMILLTKKSSNISKPKDLFGKKVMLTPDAQVAVAIQSMIESQGVQLKNVNFIPHSFKLEDLINGKTDAMGGYLSNEPFLLQEKNIEYNILNPKDYGFDFYGGLLYTSKKELDNNPTRVHNFYTATMQGWKYAFEHIEETAKIIRKKYNTKNKSLQSLIYEGKVLKRLSEFNKGNLGKISLDKYSEILKIYSLLGYSHDINALKEFIIEPDQVLLSRQELKYLKNTPIHYTSMKWPPFHTNPTVRNGIEFEIIEQINKILPVQIRIKNTKTYQEAFDTIIHQKADFKVATKELLKPNGQLHFTKPIASYEIAIATKDNTGYISSLLILNDQKVAITKDSTFLRRLKNDYPRIDYVIVDSIEESLKLLAQNKVFAIIESLPILTYSISNSSFTNIKISGTTKYKHDIRFVMHKNNSLLLSILNKTIDKIPNEAIDKINSKYISINYVKTTDYSWIYKISIPLVLIILLVILSNRRLSKEIKKRLQIESTLHNVANTDALTSIYNRRRLVQILQESTSISLRYKRPLSIIFFDLDDFKVINDNYGHDIGDKILKEISSIVKEKIRTTDSFGRWGGEEFLIILPETDAQAAETTAKHIRDVIYNHDFEEIKTYVSSSFGVASLNEHDTIDTLIKRADDAVHYVKENGKNGVKVG
jgi:polar amino acid transport system substrate-binding protein